MGGMYPQNLETSMNNRKTDKVGCTFGMDPQTLQSRSAHTGIFEASTRIPSKKGILLRTAGKGG